MTSHENSAFKLPVPAYAHKDTIAANEEKSASCLGTLDSAGVGNNRQTESDFQGEEPEYNSSEWLSLFRLWTEQGVPCAVGGEGLEDHFNGNRKDIVAVFRVIV